MYLCCIKKINIMTTIESILMNIHYAKVELVRAEKVICQDLISKLQNDGLKQHWKNQLEELECLLKLAIKAKS